MACSRRLLSARLPIRYMAMLLSAGDEETVAAVYRKLMALRLYKRSQSGGCISVEQARQAMDAAGATPEELDAIYHLSSIAGFEERFVVPPFLREVAIESSRDVRAHQEETGTGFLRLPRRGW